MKRISILAIAVALVTTLAQCKKTETPTNDNEGGKVHITLDVSSNSRVIISPETGGTAFEQSDKVLVANNGHYVGTLTYNQNLRKFDGDLDTGLSEDDYLHFYLLGNKDTEENLNDATNRPTTLTVSISDQTASYPEIAYAPSTVKYAEGVTAYTARLLNKCALVKFTTDNIPSTVVVTITGMNNKVSVALGDNSFTYSKVGDGNILLHAESKTARWGILLPQGEVTGATASAYSYAMTEAFDVPVINENDYLDEGIAVNLVPPQGVINSLFSVSASQQVYFSQGNLQYQASTHTWRFAEHQNDYVGGNQSGNVYVNEVNCNNGEISSSYDGWIDLFGWATSGYQHGFINCPNPWAVSYHDNDYYAYGNNSKDLYAGDGKADWGYNAISNGGNTENSGWRTLTKDEWTYLFYSRTDAASKYGYGKVNGVNGLVILPDDWTLPEGLSFTSDDTYSWPNVYTTEQWARMEANGAVFLPAAGLRNSTTISEVEDAGYYWSSTHYDDKYAYSVYFLSCALYPLDGDNGNSGRHYGHSVRLVRNY